MKSSLRRLFTDGRWVSTLAYSSLVVIVLIQFGCGVVGTETPKSEFVGTPPPVATGAPAAGSGTVVNNAGFFLALASPTGTDAVLHRAQNGGGNLDYNTWLAGTQADNTGMNVECQIPLGTSGAAANYLCILDIQELDLYFNPITIQYHVPTSMCTYLYREFYSFWRWEPGAGPAIVSYEVWENGTINNRVNATATGLPDCQYDYSRNGTLDRPDCCYGSYMKTVTMESPPNGPSGNGPWVITNTPSTYPGKESNCAGGPEFTFIPRDSTTGFPAKKGLITYISGTGINSTQSVEAAVDLAVGGGVRRNFRSNLLMANFHNPAAVPFALSRPSVTTGWVPKRVFDFQCLNAAEDVQSRIALLIREWDTSPVASGGNPDAGYGGVLEPPPYADKPLNDRYDWRDIDLAQYPDDDI